MLKRNLNLAGVALIAFTLLAKSTETGAMVFLAPGVFIARVIFPRQPDIYTSVGSGPDKALVDYLVHKTAENYSAALWCSIGFWFLVGVVVALVFSRTSSRDAPNTSLERTRGR